MLLKPPTSQIDDLVQCSRLLEEMCRPRHDLQAFRACQLRKRLLIQLHNIVVSTTDDEQRGCPHARQLITREIRPAAARYNGRSDLSCEPFGVGRE